jgi:hypothetical protein
VCRIDIVYRLSTFWGCGCCGCGICVYGGGGGILQVLDILYVDGFLCFLSIACSLSYVAVLFCRFYGLMLLFTAMCLTLVDYFVLLCGSVIWCVLILN